MLVKPASGLKVRDPVKKDYLPVDGREVPDTSIYWTRRIQFGDVVLVDPETPAPAKSVSKDTSAKPVPAAIEGGDKA
jgi:hypothetical protein